MISFRILFSASNFCSSSFSRIPSLKISDTFLQKRIEFDQGLDHLYDPQNHVDAKDLNGLVQKYGTLDQIKGTEGRLVFKDGKIVRTQ